MSKSLIKGNGFDIGQNTKKVTVAFYKTVALG